MGFAFEVQHTGVAKETDARLAQQQHDEWSWPFCRQRSASHTIRRNVRPRLSRRIGADRI